MNLEKALNRKAQRAQARKQEILCFLCWLLSKLKSAAGRWMEGSKKAKGSLKEGPLSIEMKVNEHKRTQTKVNEGCSNIFQHTQRNFLRKPTQETKRSAPMPKPFALCLPALWPSFASVQREVRRLSEGQTKAKRKPKQGGMNMPIKADQSKAKQNKVNQGSLKFFQHLSRKAANGAARSGSGPKRNSVPHSKTLRASGWRPKHRQVLERARPRRFGPETGHAAKFEEFCRTPELLPASLSGLSNLKPARYPDFAA
jgi:hypothetical protein